MERKEEKSGEREREREASFTMICGGAAGGADARGAVDSYIPHIEYEVHIYIYMNIPVPGRSVALRHDLLLVRWLTAGIEAIQHIMVFCLHAQDTW